MKTILAFGDSLTRRARVTDERQWPALVEQSFGGAVRVINEGLGGRTTAFDVAGDGSKNGVSDLAACLDRHRPVDLLIIMLGSNDLKPEVAATAEATANGLTRLIESIGEARQRDPAMRLLILSPPIFGPSELADGLPRSGRSIGESRKLAGLYEQVAIAAGADFLDAAKYARVSRRDGVHLDEDQLQSLATGLYPEIIRLIEQT